MKICDIWTLESSSCFCRPNQVVMISKKNKTSHFCIWKHGTFQNASLKYRLNNPPNLHVAWGKGCLFFNFDLSRLKQEKYRGELTFLNKK